MDPQETEQGVVSREPFQYWMDKNFQPGRAGNPNPICPFFRQILLVARLAGVEDIETRNEFCGFKIWGNAARLDTDLRDEKKTACTEVYFALWGQIEFVSKKVLIPEMGQVDFSPGADFDPAKAVEVREWLKAFGEYGRKRDILQRWSKVLNKERSPKELKMYTAEEIILAVKRIVGWLYVSAISAAGDRDSFSFTFLNLKCPQAPGRQ